MKLIFLLLVLPLCTNAQYRPNEKLSYKIKVVSDTSIMKGYFVEATDSSLIISPGKKYLTASTIDISANTIKEIRIRLKGNTLALPAAGFVVGFIVAAGLTKNAGDIDNDGKTSFFELLFTAIEGSTSGNRRRRNTALIVGAAGGTAVAVIGMVANKRLSLVFPISGRNNFYQKNRDKINEYVRF
jgi:hypothetical protein